jgi:hypothetical protein
MFGFNVKNCLASNQVDSKHVIVQADWVLGMNILSFTKTGPLPAPQLRFGGKAPDHKRKNPDHDYFTKTETLADTPQVRVKHRRGSSTKPVQEAVKLRKNDLDVGLGSDTELVIETHPLHRRRDSIKVNRENRSTISLLEETPDTIPLLATRRHEETVDIIPRRGWKVALIPRANLTSGCITFPLPGFNKKLVLIPQASRYEWLNQAINRLFATK